MVVVFAITQKFKGCAMVLYGKIDAKELVEG